MSLKRLLLKRNTIYINDILPIIKIYILCYSQDKLEFAIEKYKEYSWAYPILMKYQDITFENAFWKQLLEIKEEWINCEMVGTLSWKSYQKIDLNKINNMIINKEYKDNIFFPFYYSNDFVKSANINHPHFQEIWSDLLTEFNFNDCMYVHCNYWIAKPRAMEKFIDWFLNIALPKVLNHKYALIDSEYKEGLMNKEELLKLTGYPYYPMVPFIFERLNPCFYYNFENYNFENYNLNNFENKVFIKLTSYDLTTNITDWYKYNTDTGLGNMLFQIASGLAYSIKNNATLYVPNLNTYFRLEGIKKEDTIFRKINTEIPSEYNDNNYLNFMDNIHKNIHDIKFTPNICLKGYFENYLNIDEFRNIILDYFTNNDINNNLIKNNDSCSIHIRGGEKWLNHFISNRNDYINNYQKCIDYMIVTKNIKTLFVMTNDKNFSSSVVNKYNDKLEIIFTNGTPQDDLWAISLIKNNITSPSTLSFWGSYLNTNEDKFIISHNSFKKTFFLPNWIIIN